MNWRWALRDLARHRLRTALSLAGIAVAAALLLDMMMLSGGLERSFEKLLLSRGYQLRVTPKGTLPFDTEATMGSASDLVARIRAEPGVAEAGAMLATSVHALAGAGRRSLVAYGVDPSAQGFYVLESGTDLVAADLDGLLLGLPAAASLGLGIGDTVDVAGRLDPQVAVASGTRRMVVRGTARFLYDARDQPSVAMNLATTQTFAGRGARDRASVIMVRATDDSAAAVVAGRLRERIPEVGVSSTGEMVVQFRERLSYFRQLSLILGMIALVVTVLLVGTLLAITVNEQIGAIATLRAIGVARESVFLHVMQQGLALTVAGGVAGLGLGIVTARWLDAILTSFPGLPASISFFVAEPGSLLRAAVALLITGVVAGL
ncbi:MAG: ABC transporter permease, partial [Gemmatimonadales bacterium]|nr:ABC transporter permease [Gemmatimonadales bacterium]